MKKIIKNTLILACITVISGCLLGLVYEITEEPIAEAEENSKQEADHAAFELAESFETIEGFDEDEAKALLEEAGFDDDITEVATALDKNGEAIGYVISVTSHEGYGGDITLTVGIGNDGTTEGIEILTINETAGLGMKAKEEDFRGQFREKQVDSFVFTKMGATEENEIDAISGATYTTTAVTNAVNASLYYFQSELGGSVNE